MSNPEPARDEFFRRNGARLGDPGLRVRTTTDGCEPGLPIEGLEHADPAVFALGSWVTAKHCIGDVTVAIVGDRIARATVERVVRSITVDPDGRVVSLGPGNAGLASIGVQQSTASRGWTVEYRSPGALSDLGVSFGSQVEPGWSLALDAIFFTGLRAQQLVDVNGHRAVAADSDSGTEGVTWFESPYLQVTVSAVMPRAELLVVARSIEVVAGSDPIFEWPGAGPDGYVPAHLPDPSAYQPGGYAGAAHGEAVCRYREIGAKGGELPYCTPLDERGATYLPGFIGQPLLVRVPATAVRLVDPATGQAVAVRNTGIVSKAGERVWEVAGSSETAARSYRVMDRAGNIVRCVSAVVLTC